MKIVALTGGVGGAKLVDGLAQFIPPEDLSIIVNTGDDFEHLGLYISPDLDTVCYTLAGLANLETGWGLHQETFHMLENLQKLGGPDWFHLGDHDLATHLERTRRFQNNQSLSQVTRDFCHSWGVRHTVLPMSDQPVRTMVQTEQGELAFQEYFVHQQCMPKVKGFRYAGIEAAIPAPGVFEAIDHADAVIICPSNPWVSIDPILEIAGLRSAIGSKMVIAVSPFIGGQTVKGPAAKICSELGFQPSAMAVASHYEKILSGFILDREDLDFLKGLSCSVLGTDILMRNVDDRRRLAKDVLDFVKTI
jgi:LPPG:FO 2-phospho-L-lactate transferase